VSKISKGGVHNVSFRGEAKRDDFVGKFHTHPNEGKRNAENNGTFVEGPGPNTSVDRLHSNKGNCRNVIVGPKSIYLYTKNKRDIVMPIFFQNEIIKAIHYRLGDYMFYMFKRTV